MSRTLIAGTSYIADEGRRELTLLWARVARHLNRDTEIWLIDSASPFDPREFIPQSLDINIFRLDDNIGAISQGMRDGSGRSFCTALQIAIDEEYDYCMIWEADLIFTKPIAPIIEKMAHTGVKVAAPLAAPYQFPEWGCSFWSVDYLRESKFIERYNWQNAPKWPIPEWRIQHMVEPEFFLLPVHGGRNEDNRLNLTNITNFYPYAPPVFLTHCNDFSLYYRLLDLNRINLEVAA